LSRLGTLKLSEIAEATGCSKASASDIRRGKWTSHVSTWEALATVIDVVVEFLAQGADTHGVGPK
jgi:transcriptional regulator with XRE-family HTH domain